MSSTGTDEEAVRAGAELTALGNGGATELGGAETLSMGATSSPGGQGPDEMPEPEATEPGVPSDVTDQAGAEPGEPEAEAPEPATDDPALNEATVPDELSVEADQDLGTAELPAAMSQMVFVDVVLLLPATHPVVVLQEADSPFRELRIPVGGAEGIAISYAGRGLQTPRPLTHELFTRVLEEFGLTLDVVRITEVRGTAFTAEMVISGRLGTRSIDCRPSDAIALALRQRLPVPIMVDPAVLEVAGTDPMGAN
ncbi:MAG: bifunctional nuclease family protein [Acidimicrobiales bacterium]|jgi:bifunctional DNase/RNase